MFRSSVNIMNNLNVMLALVCVLDIMQTSLKNLNIQIRTNLMQWFSTLLVGDQQNKIKHIFFAPNMVYSNYDFITDFRDQI